MNDLKQLHWPLILGMGALALVRPFMSITGIMDLLGKPFGPVLITALISLAWLGIVLTAKIRQPLLTLIFTGLAYGFFAILTSAILSPILSGELSGPLTAPFGIGIMAVLTTNAIWGGVIGFVAWVILSAQKSETQEKQ
jgi:hypothetical protein